MKTFLFRAFFSLLGVSLLGSTTLAQQAPAPPQSTLPVRACALTYKEAYRLAVQMGKPLVVWVGAAECPECISDNSGEFIHHITDSFPDTPSPALVVALPRNRELIKIATATTWPEGHIPTIRRLIRQADRDFARTITTTPTYSGVMQSSVPMGPIYTAPPPIYRPQVFAPTRFMGGGGGRACAT